MSVLFVLKMSCDSERLEQFNTAIRLLRCPNDYIASFGKLDYNENGDSKTRVVVPISGLLDDPSVLIEGVLFRARYLGSTQLVCEGQPTKSTRMCQAEEAVSRIKVCYSIYYFFFFKLF